MGNTLDDELASVPKGLREPLISEFKEILAEYRASDWEKVGLKAGKICEIVYTILKGYLSGQYDQEPSKPSNMMAACVALESAGSQHSRSVRIQIPRVLIALYELRNNRAIGHVSGELSPNHMDAEFFIRGCKWVVSELVRVFTNSRPDDARELIRKVTERTLPIVWDADGFKKALKPTLSTRDKVLVLAYSASSGVTAVQLQSWVNYGNLSRFRNQVLKGLDDDALIRFDRAADSVKVSPTGIRHVESSEAFTME